VDIGGKTRDEREGERERERKGLLDKKPKKKKTDGKRARGRDPFYKPPTRLFS